MGCETIAHNHTVLASESFTTNLLVFAEDSDGTVVVLNVVVLDRALD